MGTFNFTELSTNYLRFKIVHFLHFLCLCFSLAPFQVENERVNGKFGHFNEFLFKLPVRRYHVIFLGVFFYLLLGSGSIEPVAGGSNDCIENDNADKVEENSIQIHVTNTDGIDNYLEEIR